MASRLVGTSATDAKTRMRCFGGRGGVDLRDHEVVMRWSWVGFEAGDFRSQTGVDVGLGPTQTDYRECIGKAIGF